MAGATTHGVVCEDGLVAVGDADGGNRRIMMRTWDEGEWSAATLAPFGDPTAAEGTPVITPDGEYVIFSSDRHAASEPDNANRDLYRASRRSGWKEVERLTATPRYGEITLSLACDERGALWTDRRLQGEERMGLYEVRWDGEAIEVVSSLNDLHTGDPSNENFTIISSDGSTLVFANFDIGGTATDEDLFVATRRGDGWSTPRRLEHGVNTAGTETSPHFTGDGRLLFRSSDERGPGFFAVPLAQIGLVDVARQTAHPDPCA